MELFIKGQLSDSIKLFHDALDLKNDVEKLQILCNIATAEFLLEMYRKSIKTCKEVIKLDKINLRAHLLLMKCWMKLNKSNEVTNIIDKVTLIINNSEHNSATYDASIVAEILILKERYSRDNTKIYDNHASKYMSLFDSFNTINNNIEQQPIDNDGRKIGSGGITVDGDKNDVTSESLKSLSEKTPTFIAHGIALPPPPPPSPSPISSSSSSSSSSLISEADEAIYKLQFISKEFIGNGPNQINEVVLQTVRSNLTNASGIIFIDNLIAVGYLQTNTGNLELAIEIFSLLIKYRPNLLAAHIGLGSCMAMTLKFDEAILSFTNALSIDSTVADIWKRRAQTRTARGLYADALFDFERAFALGTDTDTYVQRALCFQEMKNYAGAYKDLKRAIDNDEKSSLLFNMIGICSSQLGLGKEAIASFKLAINLDSNMFDAYVNLSQIYKEMGLVQEAIKTFTDARKIIESRDDYDRFEYTQHVPVTLMTTILRWLQFRSDASGQAYIQQINEPLNIIITWVCSVIKNNISYSLSTHSEANKSDSTNGSHSNDEKTTNEAGMLFGYISFLYYSAGHISSSLYKMFTAIFHRPTETAYFLHIAVCLQTLGQYKEAVRVWDAILARRPNHYCIHQRNCAVMIWKHLDCKCREQVNIIDMLVPEENKDGWCKGNINKSLNATIATKAVPIPKDVAAASNDITSSSSSSPSSSSSLYCVQKCLELRSFIQLDCEGFIANIRQHAIFGCSVVDTMIQMIQTIKNIDNNLKIDNTAEEAHIIDKIFSIPVIWRQISEPNDPVWWIHQMPQHVFQQGYGLQTPMLNGQLRTIRYFPYFRRGLSLVISILRDEGSYYDAAGERKCLSQQQKEILTKIIQIQMRWDNNCSRKNDSTKHKHPNEDEEGVRLLGILSSCIGEDFYVITQCKIYQPLSNDDNLEYYEGTRLTVVHQMSPQPASSSSMSIESKISSDTESVPSLEFTIRTPSTPSRFKIVHREMRYTMMVMLQTIAMAHKSSCADYDQEVILAALKVFYVWVNYAPLSRGTAFCGYVLLLSSVLAGTGKIFLPGDTSSKMTFFPKGVQLDWEAIFEPDQAKFCDKAMHWLMPFLRPWVPNYTESSLPTTIDPKHDKNNKLMCMRCNTSAAVMQTDPCSCFKVCKSCAMKLASGGKCKVCKQMYAGYRSLPPHSFTTPASSQDDKNDNSLNTLMNDVMSLANDVRKHSEKIGDMVGLLVDATTALEEEAMQVDKGMFME